MVHSKKLLSIFLFLGVFMQVQAQDLFNLVSYETPYAEYSAILLDGKPLADKEYPNRSIQLDPKATGILSVATLTSSSIWPVPQQPVGFKLVIKKGKTNSLWMYAEETLYEVDLNDVLPKCEEGDRLIFMTVDKKYHLPHHEILLGDGC